MKSLEVSWRLSTVSSSIQLCIAAAADVGWEDLEHSEEGTEVLRSLEDSMVGDLSQFPKEQDFGHCCGRSKVGSRCLLSALVELGMSLAHGMGSWRIHTGHPKHVAWLR